MQQAENTAVIRGNCVVIITDRVVKSMFSSVLCHPVLLQVIFQSQVLWSGASFKEDTCIVNIEIGTFSFVCRSS